MKLRHNYPIPTEEHKPSALGSQQQTSGGCKVTGISSAPGTHTCSSPLRLGPGVPLPLRQLRALLICQRPIFSFHKALHHHRKPAFLANLNSARGQCHAFGKLSQPVLGHSLHFTEALLYHFVYFPQLDYKHLMGRNGV